MKAIETVSEIPAYRHFALIERTDSGFSYTPYTDAREYTAALEARVAAVGTGNVTGISVQSKAKFEVAITAA